MSRIALFDEYLYGARKIIVHTFSFYTLCLFLSYYKIYLEIRHSFLNLIGPLLPIGTQGDQEPLVHIH